MPLLGDARFTSASRESWKGDCRSRSVNEMRDGASPNHHDSVSRYTRRRFALHWPVLLTHAIRSLEIFGPLRGDLFLGCDVNLALGIDAFKDRGLSITVCSNAVALRGS